MEKSSQYRDTGKLTNYHYGTAKDKRNTPIQQTTSRHITHEPSSNKQ